MKKQKVTTARTERTIKNNRMFYVTRDGLALEFAGRGTFPPEVLVVGFSVTLFGTEWEAAQALGRTQQYCEGRGKTDYEYEILEAQPIFSVCGEPLVTSANALVVSGGR